MKLYTRGVDRSVGIKTAPAAAAAVAAGRIKHKTVATLANIIVNY